MYFGELAEHSEQYQLGHMSGVTRAYDDAIYWIETLMINEKPNAKYTSKEILEKLKHSKRSFIEFCDTFGMGIEDNEND